MKIKDLPPDTNLKDIKVKTTDGTIGYWAGQWQKGVWLRPYLTAGTIVPHFVDSLKECLEWEIINEDKKQLP